MYSVLANTCKFKQICANNLKIRYANEVGLIGVYTDKYISNCNLLTHFKLKMNLFDIQLCVVSSFDGLVGSTNEFVNGQLKWTVHSMECEFHVTTTARQCNRRHYSVHFVKCIIQKRFNCDQCY